MLDNFHMFESRSEAFIAFAIAAFIRGIRFPTRSASTKLSTQ